MRSNSKNKPKADKEFKSTVVSRAKAPKIVTQKKKTEAIPTPIKLKWENDLELYQKNEALHQWIEHEAIKYNYMLKLFKGLNSAISDIIIKKKIKIYELDRKLQSDKDKKEKEEYEFKKSIEQKVDSALMKANQTLENIKLLSKSKQAQQLPSIGFDNVNKQHQQGPSVPKTSISPIEAKHKEIAALIKKCQDKYVDSLQLNESNMKTYFIPLTKTRALFKESKDRLRRLKQKSKQLSNIFSIVYINNKPKSAQMEIDNESNGNTIRSNSNSLNYNVDLVIRLSSILSSDLFRKLYLKVLYSKSNENKIDEEHVYNAFSLWYMLNHLNEQFKAYSDISDDSSSQATQAVFISGSIVKVFNEKNAFDPYFDYSSQKILDHFVVNHLSKYFEYLNKKSNEDDKGVINETAIFNNDFYKCYNRLINIEKIRFAKFIQRNAVNIFDKGNLSQEELNYFKNIQCIYVNNGSYCCNICNSK